MGYERNIDLVEVKRPISLRNEMKDIVKMLVNDIIKRSDNIYENKL